MFYLTALGIVLAVILVLYDVFMIVWMRARPELVVVYTAPVLAIFLLPALVMLFRYERKLRADRMNKLS